MRYTLTRIVILTLLVMLINLISDYVSEQEEFAYMDGVILFFRLLFILLGTSGVLFAYETYQFKQRGKTTSYRQGIFLIVLVSLILLLFSGYFKEFAF
ncbi:hypothetical protein M2408_002244 [Sphingobacterium sp. BIGb0165]|nr:hypothetical protein [Sphingobacterium sp. BIGb0165]